MLVGHIWLRAFMSSESVLRSVLVMFIIIELCCLLATGACESDRRRSAGARDPECRTCIKKLFHNARPANRPVLDGQTALSHC